MINTMSEPECMYRDIFGDEDSDDEEFLGFEPLPDEGESSDTDSDDPESDPTDIDSDGPDVAVGREPEINDPRTCTTSHSI